MNKINIHGYTVTYEDDAYTAVKYLNTQLDFYEARVFFDAARNYGQAPFEDQDYRQNYILERTREGYHIRRR